jgi:hypothetical protein
VRVSLVLIGLVGLASCGGGDAGAAPEATASTAGASPSLPQKPEPGDDALCALFAGTDEAAKADAAAKLAPRFPARPEIPLVDAARSWCLEAWPRTYMHDCGEDQMACSVDECTAWQHAHGMPQEQAFEACLQDCNCGE